MGDGRKTSMTFFILMGGFFFCALVAGYIFLPNMNKTNTLGTSDLTLELPIPKRDLRYSDLGMIPFCEDNNPSLSFEVESNTFVYASSDGLVMGVQDSVVQIESVEGVYIEYSPVSSKVKEGDYIAKGNLVGTVEGDVFDFRLNNYRKKMYLCPYEYLSDVGKEIVDSNMEFIGETDSVCRCKILGY